MAERKKKARDRRERLPAVADEATLRAAALAYLERYAASSQHLTRVLMTRVERSARAHGTEREEGRAAVARIVARLTEAGILNDGAYAESMARAWHRRGASSQAIRAKLAAKGVGSELAEEALVALRDEVGPNPDLAAAIAYARRRRLGPYRLPERRADFRDRDLAAMARAGFALDLVRDVVSAESREELEERLDSQSPY